MIPYIFTYGRSTRQHTWQRLSPRQRAQAVLIVQKREEGLYQAYPHILLPDDIRDLPAARQFILDTSLHEKCVMLDDDLHFLTRRTDDRGKFVPAAPEDIDRAFGDLEVALDTYAHAGMTGREAYFNVTRKIDRLEQACAHQQVDCDLFAAIRANPASNGDISGKDGLLDDLRELRHYLLLTEEFITRRPGGED